MVHLVRCPLCNVGMESTTSPYYWKCYRCGREYSFKDEMRRAGVHDGGGPESTEGGA